MKGQDSLRGAVPMPAANPNGSPDLDRLKPRRRRARRFHYGFFQVAVSKTLRRSGVRCFPKSGRGRVPPAETLLS